MLRGAVMTQPWRIYFMHNSNGFDKNLVYLQQLITEQASELNCLNQQLQNEIIKRQLLEEKLYSSDNLLEEKIRSCEKTMRSAFGAMNDIVLVVNTQQCEIKDIEVFPTRSKLLTKPEIDIIEATIEQFFEKNKNSILWQKIQDVLDKKHPLNFEYSLSLTPDKKKRCIDDTVPEHPQFI